MNGISKESVFFLAKDTPVGFLKGACPCLVEQVELKVHLDLLDRGQRSIMIVVEDVMGLISLLLVMNRCCLLWFLLLLSLALYRLSVHRFKVQHCRPKSLDLSALLKISKVRMTQSVFGLYSELRVIGQQLAQ